MKLKINVLTYLLALVMTALGYFIELLSYFVAVILHELAHAMTAKRLGYAMTELRLMPYGAAIVGDVSALAPTEEIKIALAGPLVSIALALLTAAGWWLVPQSYSVTEIFARVNLCLALTNLLPVYPLDGGRILLAVLSLKVNRARAYKRLRVFGYVVVVALAVTFFALKNPSLATMSLFLLLSTVFPPPECRYARLFELTVNKNGREIRTIAIASDSRVKSLVKYVRRDKITRFQLLSKDGNYGIICETELTKLPSELFYSASVNDAYEYLQKLSK